MDIANPPLVLVVDDDELNRDALSRRLEQRGYATRQASGGAQALELIDQQRFDLVLLDVEMPAMNGYAVLQRIRLTRPPGMLPVIMVTARDRSQDVVEALALGANDYVVKPIDLPIMLARIDTQLQRGRVEVQLRESEARYAAAMAGANDGIWDWTLGTNQFFCSDGWKVRFGYGPSHAMTVEEWFGRIHEDDRVRVRGDIDAHIAGLSSQLQVEYRMRDASEAFRWVLTRGLVVHDADGRPVRLAGSLTDVTEQKESDTLTSLSSRVLFMERLGRCLEIARRRDVQCAVLLLEIQGVRAVNDAHGRSVGDRLLAAVARRLERALRTNRKGERGPRQTAADSRPTLARLDGDEFGVLVPAVRESSEVTRLAEAIHETFIPSFVLDGQEMYVTASIGIVASTAGYSAPDAALRDAGIALSKARAQGKSHHAVFERDMRDQVLVRQQVEVDLRPALERGEFRLVYQPMLRLDRESIVGFEALLRWEHPERGLLEPEAFVSLAEDSGLIVSIGRWVLREACRQLAAWRREGLAGGSLRVSVNVCAQEFQQPGLVDYVSGLLHEYGVQGRQLEIEITERTAMSNESLTVGRLSQLRASGVSVCLDDFGAGHSSLAYLHRFPVDRLKIDRSFIARLLEVGDADSRPIVRAVLAMARDMGIDVVAEGVEGVEQFDLLCGLSCQLGQGYLFSRPVDADAATGILRNGLRWADWQIGQPSLLDVSPDKP